MERDLSQTQLGESAELSRRIVGNIERGERKIDPREIDRICKALDRGAEDLILHWSRSSLADLQQIERELHGAKERHDLVDQIAAHLKELHGRAQTELLQRLVLQRGPSSPTMR